MNHMFTLRLKELRKEADKTQEEMAKAIGVRRATYGEYERGNILPPITKIKKIAEYDRFIPFLIYLIGLQSSQLFSNTITFMSLIAWFAFAKIINIPCYFSSYHINELS